MKSILVDALKNYYLGAHRDGVPHHYSTPSILGTETRAVSSRFADLLMRPLNSKEKIRPLRTRRPSQLYLDKDGKATLTPSSDRYKEMGGKEFLQNWMNSPQYQDMMSGKEDFTREKYAGHDGEWLALQPMIQLKQTSPKANARSR